MDKKDLTRRESLGVMGAGAVVLAAAGSGGACAARPPARMPVIFVAHGAPPLLDMPDWMAQLGGWMDGLPAPKAILVLSAHWENRPTTIGATRSVPLVYDFYGFPERFYRLRYDAPGAPALASRVRVLLGKAGLPVAEDARRGLDHGAFVPLIAMRPEADVPVLQVSLPSLDPGELLKLGRALAPLRDEGVLVMGSGFMTHNMRAMDPRPGAAPPAWAAEFDAWNAETLRRGDVDALLQYQTRAPGVRLALPTHEHYAPLLVAQGAAGGDPARFPVDGWWLGAFTKRSVQFG